MEASDAAFHWWYTLINVTFDWIHVTFYNEYYDWLADDFAYDDYIFHWLEIIYVTFHWVHVLPMRQFIMIIVIGWIYDIGWYISLDGYCKCCFSLAFICGSWKNLGFTIQDRHISESYRQNMPTMPTPSPRRTRCGSCGEKFPIGWGLRNHHQSSACSPSALDEGGIEGETPEITVSSYMEDLAVKGTLDPYFFNKYASWGPRGVSRTVSECARFLRCTEVGSGSSRRHAQTFLDYTKSIGGRAHLLPKTVEGCWRLVEKVTF